MRATVTSSQTAKAHLPVARANSVVFTSACRGQIPCSATLAHHYPRPVKTPAGLEPESPSPTEQTLAGWLLCCAAVCVG